MTRTLPRLYWALAQIDEETRSALRESLRASRNSCLYAPLLDFYGEQLRIRSGRVLVPGGPQAESAWEHLVGASPHSPGEFVIALFSKDDGWLAPYYDALSRVDGPQQAYFTEPHRLVSFTRRCEDAISPPARRKAVFRPDPGLLLLVTRMPLDPDGQPHVPGDLARMGGDPCVPQTDSKLAREWSKKDGSFEHSGGVDRGSAWPFPRLDTQKGPLQAYLALSEIDRARAGRKAFEPPDGPPAGQEFREVQRSIPGLCRV